MAGICKQDEQKIELYLFSGKQFEMSVPGHPLIMIRRKLVLRFSAQRDEAAGFSVLYCTVFVFLFFWFSLMSLQLFVVQELYLILLTIYFAYF